MDCCCPFVGGCTIELPGQANAIYHEAFNAD